MNVVRVEWTWTERERERAIHGALLFGVFFFVGAATNSIAMVMIHRPFLFFGFSLETVHREGRSASMCRNEFLYLYFALLSLTIMLSCVSETGSMQVGDEKEVAVGKMFVIFVLVCGGRTFGGPKMWGSNRDSCEHFLPCSFGLSALKGRRYYRR